MATVTVTTNLKNISAIPDNTVFTFRSPQPRLAGDGSIVTTKPQRVAPVDGVLTVELEPGPCVVSWTGSNPLSIVIPDEDSDLWSLMAVAVGIPPTTPQGILLAAISTYIDAHPIGAWDVIPNKPAVVASGATQALARASIGAGTSSLALGTSSSTAKAGDYQPAAANISDATTVGRAVLKAEDAAAAKTALGLNSVDNTSDLTKPVSAAQQAALDGKALITRSSGRLPLNTKLRGGNITVKPSGGSWAGLWSEWDWNNWIKPQVDRAIALGLNAIRLIGAPQVVLNAATSPSQITQATYDSRWKQLADYATQKNLWLYPCLTEKWAFMGYTGAPNNFTNSTVTTSITTTAGVLAAYSNVIGFDVFQEGSGSGDGLVLADVLAMYTAIRAAAPGIALTTSNSSGNFGTATGFWTDTTSLQYQIHTATGGSDFVDLHVYLDGVLPTDLDFQLAALGKPLLFGEYGDTQDQTTGAQTARYEAMAGLHNRAGILGSFLWALADQDTVTTGKAGVWDNTGFAGPAFPAASTAPLSVTSGKRTNMTNVLPTFKRTELPSGPYKATNLLTAVQANPTATTSGWSAGANTYLTAGSNGLAVAATAAGNVIAGTKPTNGTPVTGTTPYIASVTMLAAASYSSKPVSLQIDWYTSANVYINSSPLTRAIDSTTAPLTISVVRISPSNAAFAVLTFKGYGFAINEHHELINCSLRQYGAGELPASSYPAAALPSGEGRLFGAPAGALWTSIDRTQVVISASLGFGTSGTPRAMLGGFAVPTLVTGVKFLTGTTAAVTPTNWWVAVTDTSGNVLAVSADQTTTAIPASTVVAVPFTAPTVLPAGNVYFHLMIAAGTVPTLAGVGGLLNSPAVAPVFSGASTATGLTTPPAVGGTLAAPTSQSATVYWYWAY